MFVACFANAHLVVLCPGCVALCFDLIVCLFPPMLPLGCIIFYAFVVLADLFNDFYMFSSDLRFRGSACSSVCALYSPCFRDSVPA